MRFVPASGQLIDQIVGRPGGRAFDLPLVFGLFAYAVGFLAVRKTTNLCFAAFVVLAIVHFSRTPAQFRSAFATDGVRRWLLTLAGVFIAVLFGMLARGRLEPADLDGPSRYLLSGLLLLFFFDKRINFASLIPLVAPLALILTFVAALANPEVASRWGGRFATSFVDPNTLGSYAVILSFVTLLSMDGSGDDSRWLRALKYAGVAAGVLMATLAASRGGWLAVLPLLAFWLYCRSALGLRRNVIRVLTIAAFILLGISIIPAISERAMNSVGEVIHWFDGSNTETAAGQRLSIWKLALTLAIERPWFGYGSSGVREVLAQPEFAALASPVIRMILIEGGPHNDLLGMLLGSGLPGLLSYLLLLLVPIGFFWTRRRAATGEVRLACELGISLSLGVMICGLTNEMLSLKYLASFYGITMAGLAAQVLSTSPRNDASPIA